MALIFGTDRVVDSGCREDCNRASGTSDELSLARYSRVESVHEVGKWDEAGGRAVSPQPSRIG